MKARVIIYLILLVNFSNFSDYRPTNTDILMSSETDSGGNDDCTESNANNSLSSMECQFDTAKKEQSVFLMDRLNLAVPREHPEPSIKRSNFQCNAENIISVPFNYERKLIMLKASVNYGINSYLFFLDTGAPTFISKDVVADNKLRSYYSSSAFDIKENTVSINLYMLDNITIGGNNFNNLIAAGNENILKMPIFKGAANGGLIGANIMKNSVWMIDYQSQFILISNNIYSFCLPEDRYVTKMYQGVNGSPVIKVKLSVQEKASFIIDVGFNGSILINDIYFSKSIFVDSLTLYKAEKFSTGFESINQHTKYKFLESISIGDFSKEKVKSLSGGDNSKLLIGNEFLENYTVVFDFTNMQFILIPAEKTCYGNNC